MTSCLYGPISPSGVNVVLTFAVGQVLPQGKCYAYREHDLLFITLSLSVFII
jgi:hypothetical protein